MYGDCDFYKLKGILESLFAELGIKGVKFVQKKDNPTFHPGQCAELMIDGRVIGVMGQIQPKVARNFKIGAQVFAAELDFAALVDAADADRHYVQLPKFPATTRDIAVVLDEKINVGQNIEKDAPYVDLKAKKVVNKKEILDMYESRNLMMSLGTIESLDWTFS